MNLQFPGITDAESIGQAEQFWECYTYLQNNQNTSNREGERKVHLFKKKQFSNTEPLN